MKSAGYLVTFPVIPTEMMRQLFSGDGIVFNTDEEGEIYHWPWSSLFPYTNNEERGGLGEVISVHHHPKTLSLGESLIA